MGIYLKEKENSNSKWYNTCTLFTIGFIAALFTTAKTWKQPRLPSTYNWLKKIWCIHIHNGVSLSHKKNEILPFAATWMKLENILLSEITLQVYLYWCTGQISILFFHDWVVFLCVCVCVCVCVCACMCARACACARVYEHTTSYPFVCWWTLVFISWQL